METTTQDALPDLAQFTGTACWYRHWGNRNLTFTDGAKYVAEVGGAYWLVDEIALVQLYEANVKAEPFQLWKLAVADTWGVLTCEDGDGREIYRKDIPFTDFPRKEIQFFLTDNVLMLPSEY